MHVTLEAIFPKLAESEYEVTSPESDAYNCVAWAAGDELGALEDVIHDSLESLAGEVYGQAIIYLRRPVRDVHQ